MSINLAAYETLAFDCDGVILDSNRVKTEAFYSTALPWGTTAANMLVAHHVANGGISRHRKFQYFIDQILSKQAQYNSLANDIPKLDELLKAYSEAVCSGLAKCQMVEGLESLRSATKHANWLVVSGGDQRELRELFRMRKIDRFFDGGIFGSPDSKDTILARERSSGIIRETSLYFGDSRYDCKAAENAGLDFVFVSGWTEVSNWRKFVEKQRLKSICSLGDLL